MKTTIGLQLCLCLLLAFAVVSSARNAFIHSEEEMMETSLMEMEGRSLRGRARRVRVNEDYGEPAANPRNNPKNRGGRPRH